jgi:predicted nuclease of predicted toxin-antitoxin system
MGVSMSTVRALRAAGHEVSHLGELGLQRLSDSDILDRARAEGRVVITFDLDFGALLSAGLAAAPSVILFRLHDARPDPVTRRLMQVIAEAAQSLVEGSLVVVEDARYRVRRLPFASRA